MANLMHRLFPSGGAVPVEREAGRTGFAWQGVITTHVLPADTPEDEIQAILAGGMARLRHPDGYSRDGVPLFRTPPLVMAQAIRDLDRIALDRFDTRNIACNAGRTVLLDFVSNAGGLTGVQYFAVGTGAGTPASTDTQLFTEFFRKIPASSAIVGNAISITTVFNSGEGNTTYTEAGLFGDGATSSANSGQLFAHTAYVYTKTSAIVLNNIYQITFQ